MDWLSSSSKLRSSLILIPSIVFHVDFSSVPGHEGSLLLFVRLIVLHVLRPTLMQTNDHGLKVLQSTLNYCREDLLLFLFGLVIAVGKLNLRCTNEKKP